VTQPLNRQHVRRYNLVVALCRAATAMDSGEARSMMKRALEVGLYTLTPP
jgi:hypothetical protein